MALFVSQLTFDRSFDVSPKILGVGLPYDIIPYDIPYDILAYAYLSYCAIRSVSQAVL